MAYVPGAIEATLAAAVGDEPALIAELRFAFVESARDAWQAMDTAGDAVAWHGATIRLKGLAASFGASRLMALAMLALESEPGDRALLAKLHRMIERL